ncbi:MAG: hypothetical protein QNJ58_18670 [Desulfobacterales bacterium]|nr:hypothetical protein [Desulfobacterales bacterium]
MVLHRSGGSSSHHCFMRHEMVPRLVGDPNASPSHQRRSSASASSMVLKHSSTFSTERTPSATYWAMFAVLPESL